MKNNKYEHEIVIKTQGDIENNKNIIAFQPNKVPAKIVNSMANGKLKTIIRI